MTVPIIEPLPVGAMASRVIFDFAQTVTQDEEIIDPLAPFEHGIVTVKIEPTLKSRAVNGQITYVPTVWEGVIRRRRYVDLVPTDDPSWQPTGWGYKVTVSPEYGKSWAVVIDAPRGATREFSAIIPLTYTPEGEFTIFDPANVIQDLVEATALAQNAQANIDAAALLAQQSREAAEVARDLSETARNEALIARNAAIAAQEATNAVSFTASAETVSPYDPAVAEVTGSAPNFDIDFEIPRGKDAYVESVTPPLDTEVLWLDPTVESLPESGSPYELRGEGNPNGVVSSTPGTYYTDTLGTNGVWMWIKTTGTGNTGWIQQTTDSLTLDVSVEEVSADTPASAVVTGTSPNFNLALDIPRGHDAANLSIGTVQPVPPTGETVLWVDTSGGNVTLNLVTGD